MEKSKIDRALVGIRPDNHPEAYQILMDLKRRGEPVVTRYINREYLKYGDEYG